MRIPLDLEPIEPLLRRIVERLDPEEIWLFGSRAEGRARPDSDYDLLAVLGDEAPESDLDLVRAWEITCGLGIPRLLAQEGNHYAAYHCQQASEKLIRTLLIHRDIEPGLDHHLDILAGKLPDSEPWKAALKPLHKFTPYATTYRYATPGGRVPSAPEPSKIAIEAEQLATLIALARKELVGDES